FLLPLLALLAVTAAWRRAPAEKGVLFKEPKDLVNGRSESTNAVKDRVRDCWDIMQCKSVLKRVLVKGNTEEERYNDLLRAINSVEVKDWLKKIDSVTNPTVEPESTTEPSGEAAHLYDY
ncbi:hypothetical protein PENTCL1PPCAC_27632, partial [Pristionchus entomophagus]